MKGWSEDLHGLNTICIGGAIREVKKRENNFLSRQLMNTFVSSFHMRERGRKVETIYLMGKPHLLVQK